MGFDIFAPRNPALFGVDINASAVKMVELSGGAKTGLKLEGYAIESLPRDVLVDGKIDKPEVLNEALGKALKKLNSRAKHVALALPAQAVISRKLVVPGNLRADELDGVINTEAQQYIPFQMDEVNVDYQVLGPVPGATPAEGEVADLEVFFVAARKELIDDRVAAIETAGLRARVVEGEQFAVQRAVQLALERESEPLEGRNIMLVDIGSHNTGFTVYRDGRAEWSRESALGGSQLDASITQIYSMELAEAEKAKLGKHDDLEGYQEQVLDPFLESVAQEISRAQQLFVTSTNHTTLDLLCLIGGSSALPGLPEYLAETIGIPTRRLNPFSGMTINPALATGLAADAGMLALACGLALRRVAQ